MEKEEKRSVDRVYKEGVGGPVCMAGRAAALLVHNTVKVVKCWSAGGSACSVVNGVVNCS